MLVVIGSMLVPICSRFHERLANNSKLTTFTGVPLFDAFVRSFTVPETRVFQAADGENLVILACTVFD